MCSNKVITFGCRLNSYESNIIENILTKVDVDDNVVVINSCAVTQDAEKALHKSLNKLAKENKKVILTGCASQIRPDFYQNYSNVIKIIDNSLKNDIRAYKSNQYVVRDSVELEKIDESDVTFTDHFINKSRAIVKVQDGCEHSCTFCITTVARGESRSISVKDVVKQVKLFADNGYSEIVLTGVDLSSYGLDFTPKVTLGMLVRRILIDVPNLMRLRLSSIDVAEIDDILLHELRFNKRIASYLHLSIQSGDNLILKRMKRRHSREDVIAFCNDLRKYRDDFVFGGDFIAGFPTEKDIMHENSLKLIEEANITYIHAFTYSERVGTKAALMPQVEQNCRKLRCKELIDLGDKQKELFYIQQQHKVLEAVVEGSSVARASNFALIKFANKHVKIKTMVEVYIYDYQKGFLLGHII